MNRLIFSLWNVEKIGLEKGVSSERHIYRCYCGLWDMFLKESDRPEISQVFFRTATEASVRLESETISLKHHLAASTLHKICR